MISFNDIFFILKKKYYLNIRIFHFLYKKLPLHSRIVFLLKIAIPSIVAIFLSVMIILPELNNEMKRIKFALPSINTIKQISFDLDNGKFYGESKNNIIYSININKIIESNKNTQFSDITGNIFFPNNKIVNFMTSKGIYKKVSNKFIMNNNIHIYDDINNKIYTDEAIINLDNMDISGNKKIKFISNIGIVEGNGFEIKDQTLYKFKGSIKGNINI